MQSSNTDRDFGVVVKCFGRSADRPALFGAMWKKNYNGGGRKQLVTGSNTAAMSLVTALCSRNLVA